jgi:hypothetical protein
LYSLYDFIPGSNGLCNLGSSGTNNNYFWKDIYCNYLTANNTVKAQSFIINSDYRIKEKVTSLDETFHVDYLNPVTYINKQTQKVDIGLIAHELQEHYPELVFGVKDGPEIQSVNYIGLIPILINEIKNLKNNNVILDNEIKIIKDALKNKDII